MAKKRQSDLATSPLMHRTLTPPGVFLIRMLIFLTLVAFLTALKRSQPEVYDLLETHRRGGLANVRADDLSHGDRHCVRVRAKAPNASASERPSASAIQQSGQSICGLMRGRK